MPLMADVLQTRRYGELSVLTVPVLSDNYIYLLHDEASGATAAIDPAEADPVLEVLEQRGWTLHYVFNTHHHADHVGGNEALKHATGCRVAGYDADAMRIPGIDLRLQEGARVSFGTVEMQVMFVPGHTLGHIAYYLPRERVVFCGDTLFLMGCGRLFEGTAAQMHASLQALAQLPEDTAVYCTHEYTEANGAFARSIEPENVMLERRVERVRAMRQAGEFTVPGNMAEEKHTNPFLRCDRVDIRQRLGMPDASEVAVFAEMRKRKDRF